MESSGREYSSFSAFILANRVRLPGLDYVILEGENYGTPFPIMAFNKKTFPLPELKKLGKCRYINEFEKLSTIARGEFGTFYKVRETATNQIYAIKKLRITKNEYGSPADVLPQNYLRQIENMRKLKHPNILELKDVVVGLNLQNNYLLLEYCRYSLENVIQEVSPVFFQHPQIKNVMLQLLNGLQHMHFYDIIHRDLCPKNILFTEDGTLKIIDFCSSRLETKVDMTPARGLRWYRAPEIIFGSRKYTKAVDIWAAGCIFGEMIRLKPLLNAGSDGDVVRAMIDLLGSPSERHWPGFSKLPVPRHYRLRRQPYSRLHFVFHNQTITTVNYLQKFLKYNPASRAKVEELLMDRYYLEYPRSCLNQSLHLCLKASESF